MSTTAFESPFWTDEDYMIGFIRGLLENVGAEIDPIRLIRRIKNGLEIPGLKVALIKILQDFNLQVCISPGRASRSGSHATQISLMEGCKTILYSDCRQLALTLHDGQTHGYLWTGVSSTELLARSTDDDVAGETKCQISQEPIFPHLSGAPMPVVLPFGVSSL